MLLNRLKNFFNQKPPALINAVPLNTALKFKIVVIDFFDTIDNNNGYKLSQILGECDGIDVEYYNENFDKSFLNLESRNIFDLIDKGLSVISKTNADVLIWGYRNKNSIRINFQNKNQYENGDQSFVYLLDCLYIPANFLNGREEFPKALLNLIYGAAVSSINRVEKEYKIYKKYLLKKSINELSKIDSVKPLGLEYLPYIMSFLGVIYMSLAYESQHDEDFKVIKNLFENALKHQSLILNPTHLGCIYCHLGQLYDSAARHISKKPSAYFRGAIANYQTAQKYLSKYTYPYDYGYICYKIACLYLNYWKQTEDIQALRDAVFQLREAEKIYTQVLFPEFWSHIQGDLGHMLHNLGHLTKSNDICHLAVSAYKQQQKVVTERINPIKWAYIQEKIGEIYYMQGKTTHNSEYLEDALACFHDSLFIFEKSKNDNEVQKLKISISKAYQIISEDKDSIEERI
jgi:hypothetical protein